MTLLVIYVKVERHYEILSIIYLSMKQITFKKYIKYITCFAYIKAHDLWSQTLYSHQTSPINVLNP